MDAAAMGSARDRAALLHGVVSLVLLAASLFLAPAKFATVDPLFALLTVVLLVGGAASARAAWTERARHGIELPGWSPFARGWWAWDPPLRAFHWAMCAHVLLVTWGLILAAVVFELLAGIKLPSALDRALPGQGDWLTGPVVAVVAGVGAYLLTQRWARRGGA